MATTIATGNGGSFRCPAPETQRGRAEMCELLAMSANGLERPTYAFRGFVYGSRESDDWRKSNPHGWGVACYPERGPAAFVLKEPHPARDSPFAQLVQAGHLPSAEIHLLHIRRRSSTGAPAAHANTHPFARIVGRREYVFAHNGGLNGIKRRFPTDRFLCLGDTTSEHAFCYILEQHLPDLEARRWNPVHQTLRRLNELGHLNCILSDGEVLMVYRDQDGYKGLSYVERTPPFPTIHLVDETDFCVDLRLSKDMSRRVCIFATRRLTEGEEWAPLPPGHLLVAVSGRIEWRSDAR